MEDDGILYVPIPNLIRTSTENVKIGDEYLLRIIFSGKRLYYMRFLIVIA
jgi:hypothetical protein